MSDGKANVPARNRRTKLTATWPNSIAAASEVNSIPLAAILVATWIIVGLGLHSIARHPRPIEGYAMNGDGFLWLQPAAPLAVLAAAGFVYWFTARQDATNRGR